MKALTIQDISCYGQCSLTVAHPILSSLGIETAIIPTAVLSTHTMFNGFTFHDLTEEMPKIKKHWEDLNIKFDGGSTGYVGSIKQIDYILDIYESVKKENTIFLVDPAMADNGMLYKGFDKEFPKEMLRLCKRADIILPNITEACLMLDIEYKEIYDLSYIKLIKDEFLKQGINKFIITGVSFEEDKLGIAVYDNELIIHMHDKIGGAYHGTGDIYSAITFGNLLKGKSLLESGIKACEFVKKSIIKTIDDESHKYGVKFEEVLEDGQKDL